MNEFNNLLEIANILLGPKGCDWDKEQTFESLKKYFIEEVNELSEGIDNKDDANISEELGDVLYLIIFLVKIAEKDKKFTLKEVIKNLIDKLTRRHPHVFSDKKVSNVQEIIDNWQSIKKQEKIDRLKEKNI
ncbi:MAG: Nucleoside triphosphate pyrophosphohydrolase/pyrophosphatase MazG [Candidatus Anoxychlamydiales bacterium]|nr:Nucleoside triphosphate pyrophosphohydrolase/pyrophosphatase MazG [Candidatus Anoxychlamydiales bacterium]NGX36605.1 Nucleoside triphosphate pyrophosphohydrolase/pyrophosphatase MazG [Candidatus Anoxychlamydiales bacterium]